MRSALFACLLLASIPAAVRAVDNVPVGIDPRAATSPSIDPTTSLPEEHAAAAAGAGVTPVLAPIPFKNSQLGWGLAVMAGAIHRFDPDTTAKPSTGAVVGFYSENKSWGVMGVEAARLSQDRWRLTGLAAYMDVNYDFFGIGEDAGDAGASIPVDQKITFALGLGLRRIAPGLYGGVSLLWMHTTAQPDPEEASPVLVEDPGFGTLDLVAPGLQFEYDTRDDDYWPARGHYAMARSSFFTPGLGSQREFQRYAGAWSAYATLKPERLVLAANANLFAAAGDAPFWALPSVGAGLYGLRGYTQGRYRDHIVTTLQAELRAHAKGRLGAAAFFGAAQIAPSIDALTLEHLLPGGGAGLRFQLTKKYRMHLRADYAWGRNESLLYFSVNEAF